MSVFGHDLGLRLVNLGVDECYRHSGAGKDE
jgi:hypothetical protein